MRALDPVMRTATPLAPGSALLWVDGRPADPSGVHVSAFDRGLTLADGVFETLRVYGGTAFRLEQHLERLAAGLRALAIEAPPDLRPGIAAALQAAGDAGVRDAVLRLTVTRGPGWQGLAPTAGERATTLLAITPSPPPPPLHAGLRAAIARGRRNEFARMSGVKTLAYGENIAALLEARAAGLDDAIFLDTRDHVSCGTASNVFLVVGAALVTPHLACGVLPGITRRAVLELAPALGLTACAREVAESELDAAGEIFLTSSVREIAPVVQLAGRPVGSGEPGVLTRRLAEALRSLVQTECAR